LLGPKGSGKTKTISLTARLAFNMRVTSDISPSALFRVVEATRATLRCDLKMVERESLWSVLHRWLAALWRLLQRWEAAAREYLADIQAGLEFLNAEAQTDEEWREQFEAKRQIVNTLVEKVLIGKDRQIQVVCRLDVLSLLERDAESSQIELVGTCSHKQLLHPHRTLSASA